MSIKENFDLALEFLVNKIREELDAQGHKASGKLIDSVEKRVRGELGGIIRGEILIEEYGIYLDKGVAASRIRYNPEWLIPWANIVKPNLTEKEVRQFVWAVWTAHRREGMPTRGSYAYSRNGRRKEWMKYGIEKNIDEFEELLNLFSFFENFIEELVQEFATA